jgi:hypothetical protein
VNSTPQLDLHPDAESLSAFAEQALATQEREQVLTHLAGCSRCRQVIFLAQQAAADAQAPAPVPATRPAKQPETWFWNWRLAWVPAAALASALALVVTFHPRHTATAPEMAKVTPQSEGTIPARVPQERASAGAAHRPAPALTAKSLAGNADSAARNMPSEELAAPSAAPPAEFGASAPSTVQNHAVLPSSMFSSQQGETAQYRPEPAVTSWQQDQKQSSGSALSASVDASQVSQKSMRMEAYTAHASRKAASAGPRMVQQSQSAPGGSFDVATQQQLAGLSASRNANPPLPSGLAAVSRATAQNLALEIDRSGALFLSGDSGQHWEPVVQQWTGRAIEVRAKSVLSGSPTTAVIFELQNDAGSIWVSADGKTWTAQ